MTQGEGQRQGLKGRGRDNILKGRDRGMDSRAGTPGKRRDAERGKKQGRRPRKRKDAERETKRRGARKQEAVQRKKGMYEYRVRKRGGGRGQKKKDLRGIAGLWQSSRSRRRYFLTGTGRSLHKLLDEAQGSMKRDNCLQAFIATFLFDPSMSALPLILKQNSVSVGLLDC